LEIFLFTRLEGLGMTKTEKSKKGSVEQLLSRAPRLDFPSRKGRNQLE
jgi:hypothetical protein